MRRTRYDTLKRPTGKWIQIHKITLVQTNNIERYYFSDRIKTVLASRQIRFSKYINVTIVN